MQETRQQILEIIKERGEATVDDIVTDLEARRGSITAVTVRHHLSRLQDDGLVDAPQMRHRSTPGRPRHVYSLTDRGITYFPNNYQNVTSNLLKQIQQKLPDNQVNVIIEGVADAMAHDAGLPDCSMQEKLDAAVEYLNAHGYEASWEVQQEGYLLHTCNCPYHDVAQENEMLCRMDIRLVASLLGVVPRVTSRVAEGGDTCSYFIPGRS